MRCLQLMLDGTALLPALFLSTFIHRQSLSVTTPWN
jgi:hypothetical protein